MPTRLSGLWRPSGGGPRPDDPATEAFLAHFPAANPWVRRVLRIPSGLLIVDGRGTETGISTGDGRTGLPSSATTGVAGNIRLDRRRVLLGELDDPRLKDADDATLVLRAFQRWGPAALDRIEGDYAFVYWDGSRRTLSLVRDLFGVRRLHYAVGPDLVVFSTEIEGILAWPHVDRSPDDVTILDTLLGRYQTTRRTFFRSIRRVLPGHSILFRADRFEELRYGKPIFLDRPFASFGEAAEGFRSAFEESMADRLPARGKVVCHLSGGLDSSSVAAVSAAQLRSQDRLGDLILANARFPGWKSDEGPAARELADWLGVPLHEWDGRRADTSDLEHPRLAWPFGRSSVAGSRQGDLELAEKHGTTVVLSGQGGNQVTFETGYLQDALRAGGLPGYLRRLVDFLRLPPSQWEKRHRAAVFQDARTAISAGILGRPPRLRDDDLWKPLPAWLGPRLRRAWFELQDEMRLAAESERTDTGSVMTDVVWWMNAEDPNQVWTLEHEDARAVERGVEFRFPFFSRRLLAVAMSIPWHLRAPSPLDRSLMRTALRGVVPESVRARDTFVYFNEGNTRNAQRARELIDVLLTGDTWRSAAWVDRRAIQREVQWLSEGPADSYTYTLADAWRRIRDVAALEVWLAQF